MTTLTDKELIKEIKERIGSLDVRDNIERRAYEIALASLEAEPVAWMRDDADGREYNARNEFSGGGGGVPLYATPPVPVVPEEKPMPNPLSMYAVDAVAAIAEVRGWNACRAAMLQGSQPVSQTYKFPVNTPCQDAPAHIWLQTAGVWPEDGELSELTWCSHNQHHDDTLYVRADLVNGNSQVTPDSWISCSDRMPEKGQNVLISVNFDSSLVEPLICSARYTGSTFRRGDATIKPGNGIEQATHWMPLPEPPQEVK
ncbi:TPA: DUF551 domain-containing protein [Escherichia coli]